MTGTNYPKGQQISEISSLIKNPFVFTEDFQPNDVLFRQDEIQLLLTNTFNPLVSFGKGENVLLWGESGLGKTLMTKVLLEQLRTYIKEKDKPFILPVYINCSEHKTAFQVMSYLASVVVGETFNKLRGKMISEYLEMIYKHMNELGKNYLIVLDEIDKIKSKDEINQILYLLSRAKESGRIGESNVSLVCLYNDVNFRKYLDQSVKSSLRDYSIVVNPYTIDQIFGILQQRAKNGLVERVIDDDLLRTIARKVYMEESSDVRKAIQILLKAVKLCATEQKTTVEASHIDKALLELGRAGINDYIVGMNDEKLITLKALCVLIEDRPKQITSLHIFEIYTSLMLDVFHKTPTAKSLKQIQRYLDEIYTTKLINKRGTRTGNFYTILNSFSLVNTEVNNNLVLRGFRTYDTLKIIEEEKEDGKELRVTEGY